MYFLDVSCRQASTFTLDQANKKVASAMETMGYSKLNQNDNDNDWLMIILD